MIGLLGVGAGRLLLMSGGAVALSKLGDLLSFGGKATMGFFGTKYSDDIARMVQEQLPPEMRQFFDPELFQKGFALGSILGMGSSPGDMLKSAIFMGLLFTIGGKLLQNLGLDMGNLLGQENNLQASAMSGNLPPDPQSLILPGLHGPDGPKPYNNP